MIAKHMKEWCYVDNRAGWARLFAWGAGASWWAGPHSFVAIVGEQTTTSDLSVRPVGPFR